MGLKVWAPVPVESAPTTSRAPVDASDKASLRQDIERIVVCPAAVVGEVVEGLDHQGAFQQVSHNRGLLEREGIDRREGYRRGGRHIVRVDMAGDSAPV